jgi:VWFA-related protein
MRAILSVIVVWSVATGSSALLAQAAGAPNAAAALGSPDQAPVFRSGVEVMEVDVTVVDAKGMPVRDLRVPDFTVTVDNQPRRVISAEFISASYTSSPESAKPRDPYVSNNTDRRPGRLIMVVVDRNNIDTHTIRTALGAMRQFVTSIAPEDRLALFTIPAPGPSVDFTTNHAQVLDAITRIIGSDENTLSRYNVSDFEAITFENRSNPIATQRLLYRACGDTDPNTMSPCDRDVEQEALAIATNIRHLTAQSVSGYASLLTNLRDVEGPKSMIIMSQGLMLDTSQSEASTLATLAAEARVSVNVMMFSQAAGNASQARLSETLSQDRDLREAGLETLASRSRGTLFRVLTNPEYVFGRLRNELSGHYMLGVEPLERDRDGRPHQIRVQVGRQNVQIRSRRQVQYTKAAPKNWSRDVVMGRVLRSPATNTELPMRLSTYTFRDTAPNKVKVILAAEIDPESMDKELDLAIGFGLFDEMGKAVLSGQERKIYSANTDLPIRYELAVGVDPGNYRVRLAAVDMAGKSGSVERDVAAFGMANHEFAIGDLILSAVRQGRGSDLRAPVVLQVADGQLSTYTELYTNKPGSLDDSKVVFEIADSPDGPTLQTSAAELREGTDQTRRQALAVMPVGALPPGRYIARAMISRGEKNVGKLTRPFEIVGGARGARSATGALGATGATSATGALGATSALGASNAEAVKAGATRAEMTGVVVAVRPMVFKRDQVLTPEMLRVSYDVIEKNHPAAKAATARARGGKLEGTAMMALEAGDQTAGSMLRGIELLMKGDLNTAANQFGVALRNPADAPLASFFLGACYAAAGRDKEAVAAWERARAAKLPLPALQVILADGWLRLGQPDAALEPLREALERNSQDDGVRRNLAVAQSHLGLHEQAYPTIVPFLDRNPKDADALMIALHALYQIHVEGKTIGSADEDRAKAAIYARAYADAQGPQAALVEKWAEFLSR